MRNLTTSLGRMTWLLLNEIRAKMHLYGMILFGCFAILLYLFYNPGFNLPDFVYNITNPNSVRSSNGSTTFFTNIYYANSGPALSHILKYYLTYFPSALLISGCIITGLSFIEYSTIDSRRFQISLPATTTEKWLVKVVWCSVIYALFFHFIFYIFAQFIYTLGLGMGKEYVRVSFFDPYIWRSILKYIPISFMVLMGTVFFRKYSFLKFVIGGYAFYTLLNIIFNVSLTQLFPSIDTKGMSSYFNSNSFVSFLNSGHLTNFGSSILHMFPKTIQQLPSLVWYYLIGALSLGLSYMRFKEIEA